MRTFALVSMILACIYFQAPGETLAKANSTLVGTQAEYQQAASSLKPGDTIVLKNGVWDDFEILFEGKGTADAPIRLLAQDKGKVYISGQSNLRLAGEHLIVSGLVFKNGYTPTSSVITFAKDKTELAYHSRVTETVIDGFNNPERFENESWVKIYGRHNRFDHNHLSGKSTKGVTLSVHLNTPESRENYHKIDHNYFGPRPILGSNGGETLRIGTSHHSLTDSFTTVENNYFDRCDGELEIISNKSGKNRLIGNVFYQSRGTLTMRHGNDTLVENNVFFGNGADHTGGIRVINKRQTVRNNYLEGLAGYRFGGALVVMNGVPNSKINRYHQVEDSVIENNSIIESDHIQLAAGSDFERSAVPVRSSFTNNLIVHSKPRDPFTVYDDISGIKFANNVVNQGLEVQIETGFVSTAMELERASNGLLYPNAEMAQQVGVSRELSVIDKSQTGVEWYAKPAAKAKFDYGKTIQVAPGLNTLVAALENANDGDVLNLQDGEYANSKILTLSKAITIQSSQPVRERNSSPKAIISFQRAALFEIQEGGSLKLKGVTISGKDAPDSSGNTVIRTQRRSMLNNYELIVEDSDIVDLNVNHTFNFLSVYKGTFADRIELRNSRFRNITGALLSLSQENDDFGIYNAEYVTIEKCRFDDIQGDIVDYYRGGTDESTFGPHFDMHDSSLNNVGGGKRNKSASSVLLHGVQVSTLTNNTITNSQPIKVMHTVGEPVTKITSNQFVATPEVLVKELYSDQVDTADLSNNVYQQAK